MSNTRNVLVISGVCTAIGDDGGGQGVVAIIESFE